MKPVVISLGGSVIVPGKIDADFLKKFKRLVLQFKRRYHFAVYCGGGIIARDYQKSLRSIIGNDKNALDWMGIAATKLNAYLVRSVFGSLAEQEIIEDPTKKVSSKKGILVAAGWKPGWSTDYDAVLLAKNLGADKIINVTNVDYLYDKDPKLKGAKPIKEISFEGIRKIVGTRWSPGLNMPFDPVAIKKAEKFKLKIIIIGKNIDNLKNVLEGKRFKGTVIG